MHMIRYMENGVRKSRLVNVDHSTGPVYSPLSRRQFWLAALSLGVTKATVRDMLAAYPANQRAKALIEFEDAHTFERNHPLVLGLATALNLTKEQIDTAWLSALETT